MFLSSRLPLKYLIDLCRTLRHNLDAGLTLVKVFQQQSQRGPGPIRPLATRILVVLKRGDDLESALDAEKEVLPPLFLALVSVGERTGTLPEVLAALETFYQTQLRLRRELISRSMLPALQLVAAIFVIAALILILGWIASSNNTKPMDPLGIGLTGTSGAIIFLCVAFGSIGALVGAYWFAGKYLQQRAAVDRFLLRVPALGPCLYAIALSRLCMALRVTLETSLAMGESVRLALRATGNAAFLAAIDSVRREVRGGEGLALALARTQLFDEDFQSVLAVAEESGRLPEVMRHQAKYYEELAEQRLALLMRAAGFAVWAIVAILIVIAILRIFMSYVNILNSF